MSTNKQVTSTIKDQLPQPLHEVLIGYLLGDGGIFYASKRSTTPRFEFSMGQGYLLFAQHLSGLFKGYASNALKSVQVQALTNGTFLTSYRFKTRSLPVFKYYWDLFYRVDSITGKVLKVVPNNIADLLTPLSLAYLIMSDGNFDSARNRVRIYTNSFTKEDVQLLANAIYTNFNIYAGVMADKPNQFIITIGANELTKLRTLVSQHMHSSMTYRIGL